MILVDTSVWIEHLRAGSPALSRLLEQGLVLAHPSVIGELACGNLQNRSRVLADLAALPWQKVHDDVQVKLLAKDGEVYVQARSDDRRRQEAR